jgi:hypothetical protein
MDDHVAWSQVDVDAMCGIHTLPARLVICGYDAIVSHVYPATCWEKALHGRHIRLKDRRNLQSITNNERAFGFPRIENLVIFWIMKQKWLKT